MKKIKVILTLFFVFFISLNLSYAIELPRISQSKIRLSIAAGQSKYGDIVVENPGSEPKSMRIYLEDWYYLPGGDGTKEFAPVGTMTNSCSSWISFSPSEFTLPPFGKQRVSYTVKVPEGSNGGYYAAMFFENTAGSFGSQGGQVGAAVNLIIRVAGLFYVEVEGTVKREAEITNLTVKRDNSASALSIQLDLNNIGNVDITTSSTYNLMSSTGRVYARGSLSDSYTFARDKAKLTATWKDQVPKGSYDLVFTMDLGKALADAGVGRGPVIIKEASVEIGDNGEVVSTGELK